MSSTPEHEHTATEVQPLQDPLISQRFSAADSDITIQSSDGVLFQLHKVNLKISSGSWKVAMPDYQLSETSAVLDLLFQFCYPERRPDLEMLEFDVLVKLASAVETYRVYSAIDVCKVTMRDRLGLPLNAFDILIYGTTYAYPDIYQKAAPVVVLQKPMREILPRLPSNLLIPWVLYHEKWFDVAQEAVSYHEIWTKDHPLVRSSKPRSASYYCGHIDGDTVNCLLRRLGAGLGSYMDIEALFNSSCNCKRPGGLFFPWRRFVEENIANIPPFNGQSLSPTDSVTHSASTMITCQNEASGHAISTRFSAPDSDLTFLSSDGVLFHIYKINLIINAGGLVPPEFETRGEIIHLTETAPTLELLFQFCYPDRHPDVEMLEFSEFAILAKVAEKYQVFSAMNICRIRMKKLLPNHAIDILPYAAWHDYPDILDIAAPFVVRKQCLSETLLRLPPHFVIRWVKYFEIVWLPLHFPPDSRDDWCGLGKDKPMIAIPRFSTVG